MRTKLLFLALGVASLGLGACDVHTNAYLYDERPRREVVVERPYPPPVYGGGPVVVEPAPYIVVRRPLPPPRREVISRSPGPGYVWVPGYWDADRDDWRWRSGHWERPPRAGVVWREPHYEDHGGEIRFSIGGWR